MKPKGLDSPAPNMSTSSNSTTPTTGPKALGAPSDAREDQQWNSKNLGLRIASDFASGVCAASLVAPLITVIDKAIMQNASGQATLGQSLKTSFTTLLLRPHTIVVSKPFALICMLYGGTYFTANSVDTLASTIQNRPASYVSHGTTKFVASSTANVGLCLFKDQAFARMFGSGGPPRPVPLPSYVLFTFRDCLTIFASFNLPPVLGPMINKSMTEELGKAISGQTVAQFVAPAGVQIISTPMHLLGLDLYNRGGVISRAARWQMVRKNWAVSAVARMCRIVPAFGVGGVMNSNLRKSFMGKLE